MWMDPIKISYFGLFFKTMLALEHISCLTVSVYCAYFGFGEAHILI